MSQPYSVYWYAFKGYRGDGISTQNWTDVNYEGVLYKIGHQIGNDELGRVKEAVDHLQLMIDRDETQNQFLVNKLEELKAKLK